jgi:threonyl-tRNA synthetase
MLLEHYQGNLPLWLAPEQIAIASIGAAQADYAAGICDRFFVAGLRAVLDDGPETLARKIVAAHAAAIPILGVAGAREAAEDTVALRFRDGTQMVLPVEAAVARLAAAADGR